MNQDQQKNTGAEKKGGQTESEKKGFTEVENAHASGDGSIKKDDEQFLDIRPEEAPDQKGPESY